MRARLATAAAIVRLHAHHLAIALHYPHRRHRHECTLKPRLDPRDVQLWARQVMEADTETIIREAEK